MASILSTGDRISLRTPLIFGCAFANFVVAQLLLVAGVTGAGVVVTVMLALRAGGPESRDAARPETAAPPLAPHIDQTKARRRN
jgi:NAD(P)H-flavin reductase